MCDCIKIVEKQILEQANCHPRNPKAFNISEGHWECISIFPKTKMFANYIIKYTFQKANGLRTKPKNNTLAIFFVFCPFCGEKIV